MAEAWTTATASMVADRPEVRRIGMEALGTALRRGWADFVAAPTQLMFLCVLYPLIGLLAGTLAAGGDAMHLLYPMAAGFALVGPVAALGLYEISRRRERGQAAGWRNVFDVLRSPAIASIAGLALLLAAIFLAWLWVAHLIFAATVGTLPADAGDAMRVVFATPAGHRLLLWGNLAGLGFALAVLVLTVVSFPMLLDRDGGVAQAVSTSVRAFAANPVAMLGWGLVVAVVLLLGSLPLFIGLAVALPVLGHATWHLYRLVVAK
ncbi:DUF2189 domain-containing protein [Falsiroseomonas ponticola]|uniref:DUF2189 domain-containing protein n=1 Tax=Falsiroseomonas ponticola TaxID=2786951 RepID=UPI001CF7B2C9|nr:DUF2189 domain-containing protein [Roseomonas ponticola]